MIAEAMKIQGKRSYGLNLNLLLTFAAVYRESNVTKAAAVCRLGNRR
jgi:hypothetical protein